MTHVSIKFEKGVGTLVVDGADVSKKVLSKGFGVAFPEFPECSPEVSLIVAADVLEVDLPEAVVLALRVSDEAVE